jgi:opacity protein-like surface antigen
MIVGRLGRSCWVVRAAVAGTILLVPSIAAAQSSTPLSVQVSGMVIGSGNLGVDENFGSQGTRLGFEGQVRYTKGRWSVGAGFEQSTVLKGEDETDQPVSLRLRVLFVEPRYVVHTLGNNAAIYLAARIGQGTLSLAPDRVNAGSENHVALGGGAGVLIRLTNRVALDVGSQYFQLLSTSTTTNSPHFIFLRAGGSIGL